MAPKRPVQFKMMLSESEQQMLRELAEQAGLTASDYLRLYVRKQHAKATAAEKPAPRKGRTPK